MVAKKTRVAFAITLIVGALLWLTIGSFGDNMQYFVTVNDVSSMSQEELEQGVRVKGYLVPGSIEETPNSLEIFFTLIESGETMRVRFDQERPDTFVDSSEVLVEGKFTDAGYFEAKMLMAKCPSKYETTDNYDIKDYDPTTHQTATEGTD